MYQAHRNIITAALLFAADKYRQIQLRSRLFGDAVITDVAAATESEARRLVAIVPHAEALTDAEKAQVATALAGFVDDINRKCQLALAHGDLQNSALLEHRCRELYAALDAVRGNPVLPVEPVATSAEDQ